MRGYIHVMLCGSMFAAQLLFVVGVERTENKVCLQTQSHLDMEALLRSWITPFPTPWTQPRLHTTITHTLILLLLQLTTYPSYLFHTICVASMRRDISRTPLSVPGDIHVDADGRSGTLRGSS